MRVRRRTQYKCVGITCHAFITEKIRHRFTSTAKKYYFNVLERLSLDFELSTTAIVRHNDGALVFFQNEEIFI